VTFDDRLSEIIDQLFKEEFFQWQLHVNQITMGSPYGPWPPSPPLVGIKTLMGGLA
jgi:hypothetical protein